MELVLETGSTVVRAGDAVIQRGTPHAWKVVGDEPCVFVSILADAVNSPVAPERRMPGRESELADSQREPRWGVGGPAVTFFPPASPFQ